MPALSAWAQFAAAMLAVGLAGWQLTRYGDAIAGKTGLSRSWVGLVLLATVTSLPELATGLTSVTAANQPNIAVGDVLGSCVFNLAILVVIDFLHRREPVYNRASQGHILSAGFGIILIGLVGFSILLGQRGPVWSLGHVGVYTPAFLLLYFIAIRSIFLYERRQLGEFAAREADLYGGITLRQALIRYGAAATAVVAAGVWLPFAATDLADAMGWHKTFVGTLLVAAATSAPELAVTLSALKVGALDMAIANLLGSNLFDILVLAVDDLFYLPGPLLSHVSPAHALSALSALVMTGMAVVGLLYRPTTRVLRTVGWVSIGLLGVYLLNTSALYLLGE